MNLYKKELQQRPTNKAYKRDLEKDQLTIQTFDLIVCDLIGFHCI